MEKPVFVIVFALTIIFATAVRSDVVSVNKCCAEGSFMSPKTQYKCVNGTKNVFTRARVYSSGKWLAEGTYPATWSIRLDAPPDCENVAHLPLRNGAAIPFMNGSLLILELGEGLMPPSSYCLDYEAVLFCEKQHRSRVKKCCGTNSFYLDANKTCIHSTSFQLNLNADFAVTTGFPHCDDALVVGALFNETKLTENGTYYLDKSMASYLKPESFCLEHLVVNNTSSGISLFTCQSSLPKSKVATNRASLDLRFTIYPIALLVGIFFLAATLGAGWILPASHHALHWRCQTNHVACLLAGNVMLCITQLSGGDLQNYYYVCFSIAVIMHFLFLATFFWLNTMCFNIWWTFRDLRPQNLEKSQERWRLRLYEIYAWGGPIVISATAAIMDTIQFDEYSIIKPGFVTNSCWFYGRNEIFIYFYGPIGALLIINLILFGATARELTCGLWKRELVKSTTEKATLGRVCMKLVVVMGISWIADVASWAIGGPNELWYITDLINCLQGVLIFIVVGLQPQVIAAVKRVWCSNKNRKGDVGDSRNHHSSSSHGLPSMGESVTNSVTTKSVPIETTC